MAEKTTSRISPVDQKNNDSASDLIDSESVLERTVWMKLDRWIIPVITMFYLLSFPDRTNVGNARVAAKPCRTNKEYTIALTVTIVAYSSSELPSNLMLKESVARTCRSDHMNLRSKRIGTIMILSTTRIPDAIISPIAIVFSATSLSGAFSGILAFGIAHLDGKRGHSSVAWIFLIEGAITITCGLAAFFLLPRSPTHARFLNQHEKDYVVEKLTEDRVINKDPGVDAFRWSGVGKDFTSLQVVLVGIVYF
ncbi:hypothetical protein B0H13DRAFT_1918811 [Mycena leptocephala]|nr:hypothetical protein B0H13DRAFT_1918811 [Mycena leptocephala]